LQARADLGQFSRCEINAFLLYFGSFPLLVGARLLILSALVERPDLLLYLRDRPRKVGQLTSDKGYVLPGCHLAAKSRVAVSQSQPNCEARVRARASSSASRQESDPS
jgi:hypothetical protein